MGVPVCVCVCVCCAHLPEEEETAKKRSKRTTIPYQMMRINARYAHAESKAHLNIHGSDGTDVIGIL